MDLVGYIMALVGVVVGSILTTALDMWKESKSSKQKGRNVRLLLQVEIEQNVSRLTEVQKVFSTADTEGVLADWQIISQQLRGISFDVWSRVAPDIPEALSHEELRQTVTHYADLRAVIDSNEFLVYTGTNPPMRDGSITARVESMSHSAWMREQEARVLRYIRAAIESHPKL